MGIIGVILSVKGYLLSPPDPPNNSYWNKQPLKTVGISGQPKLHKP